jgi:hypothetical protein
MYKKNDGYIFVIDTESYAGNFEREMCGYCTGEIGECGVGDKEAKLFRQDMKIEDEEGPFCEKICSRHDKHGVARPASIFPTPGWFNDGMGGHFRDGQDEAEALEHHKQECLKWADDKEPENKKIWLDRANAPLKKHPAYFSVAIFFSEIPTQEEIDLIIARAKVYAKERPDCTRDWQDKTPINITGFRLIEERNIQDVIGEWV